MPDNFMFDTDVFDFRAKPPITSDLDMLIFQFVLEYGIKPEYQFALCQTMIENRGNA